MEEIAKEEIKQCIEAVTQIKDKDYNAFKNLKYLLQGIIIGQGITQNNLSIRSRCYKNGK